MGVFCIAAAAASAAYVPTSWSAAGGGSVSIHGRLRWQDKPRNRMSSSSSNCCSRSKKLILPPSLGLGLGVSHSRLIASALRYDELLPTPSPPPERGSPEEVKKEIERCYELVHKLGRGVVYLGSSRAQEDHPHYKQALCLAREVALLLNCTTWTGVGPGLMDAATKGALEAKKPVGGFKIARESGEWTNSAFHPYLPPDTYITCRFFSARKHGLVDAAVRNNSHDMTAIVAFPGGIGTLDEVFEILALIQLERIGSKLRVPFLLMNYDFFYTKLIGFLHECENLGTVASGEVASLWKVCNGNSEAMGFLSEFYGLPRNEINEANVQSSKQEIT